LGFCTVFPVTGQERSGRVLLLRVGTRPRVTARGRIPSAGWENMKRWLVFLAAAVLLTLALLFALLSVNEVPPWRMG
jgi:hypothetical protein